MKSRDIKSALRSMPAPTVDAGHVASTIALCRAGYCARRPLRPLAVRELIGRQLRFTALPVWLLQGALLSVICLVMGVSRTVDGAALPIPACASLSAELAALTALPFYGRARRYGMGEVEAAARVSRTRLALSRMAAVGVGDVVCVSAAALLCGGGWLDVLVLVAVPFLLTSAAALAVSLLAERDSSPFIAVGLSAALAALYWTLAQRFAQGLLRVSPYAALTVCAAAVLALVWGYRFSTSEKHIEKELGYET